jgi:3-oxoadipate enol-lactonase
MTPAGPLLTHRLEGESDAETVLFLNGGMMTFGSWEPVTKHLRTRYRLLLCDLRGQLLSPGPSHDDLEGHVEDLEVLLDELGIESAHLLGTSFGAEVGLQMAATRSDRVRSVVAVTAVDRFTPDMLDGAAELRGILEDILVGGERGRLQDVLVRDIYSTAYVEAHREELDARRGLMDRLPDVWFQALLDILTCTESFDLRPVLAGIACPTLIVLAGEDRVMPAERSRALARAIPGAEIAEHLTSGHALIAEDPAWMAEVCLAFFDRDTAGSIHHMNTPPSRAGRGDPS